MSSEIEIAPGPEDLARIAAGHIVATLNAALERRGEATLVLAGGSTPRSTYQRLAAVGFGWGGVDLFLGDERCVGANDPESNARMVRESLVEPARIPDDRFHRIRGELGPQEGAAEYERRLRARFPAERPGFDLILLGIGSDGHTASLFPDTPESPASSWVTPARSPESPRDRVSLTYRALAGAGRTLFLVAGASKAAVVERILEGRGAELPAARVAAKAARATWLLDRAAAARLSCSSSPSARR